MERRSVDEQIRRLVDDYRVRCLWFLHEDYYPATPSECERVLTLVEQHGDLEAFRRVAEIRACLSHPYNGTSAVS